MARYYARRADEEEDKPPRGLMMRPIAPAHYYFDALGYFLELLDDFDFALGQRATDTHTSGRADC